MAGNVILVIKEFHNYIGLETSSQALLISPALLESILILPNSNLSPLPLIAGFIRAWRRTVFIRNIHQD